MPIFPNFLLSLLLVFSVFADTEAAGANPDSTHVVSVQALQALHQRDEACSSKEYEGPGLKIIDRDGPCSPLAEPQASPFQILERDQSRVKWLQSQQLDKAPSQFDAQGVDLPSRLGTSFGTGNYIVTVGFGTPKKDMTVSFDTGSPLTWIQCQPCAGGCYHQQDPIFNPAQSSSYLNISCNSADCSQVGLPTGCSSSSPTCIYAVAYGDNSISQGFLAHDTLTLTASDVFPNFRFGCGQLNRGLFGTTAGLLGLSRREISLVSQTASKFGRVFSYCLPSTPSSTGYLKFGAEAIPAGVRYTPLLSKQEKPFFYFVSIARIIVGKQVLPIPASTFSSGPGTVIDSGTVITRLPPAAYAALRSAFRQAMSKYKMAASPVSLFDTCYDLSGVETITFPKIALSFEGGVDVDVVPSGILVALRDGGSQIVGCLAFAGNDDSRQVGIIGNRQQRAFDVVYDVAGGRLGFSPGSGSC
ncbi:hypothetical protein ACLOJK_032731 [Asimina triloba]